MVYFLIKTLCQYLLRWLSARWTFRQDNRILVWHPLQHGGACSFNLSYSLSAADPCAPSDHGHALAVPFQIVAPFILCPKEQNFQAWRDFPLCIWGWSVSRCVLHESTNSSPFPLQNLPACSSKGTFLWPRAAALWLVLGLPSFSHRTTSINVSLLLDVQFMQDMKQGRVEIFA